MLFFGKTPQSASRTALAGGMTFASSTPVKFNSVEFRDGQQSLLATRVTTEDMIPLLKRMDEVKVVYVGQDVSAYLDLPASQYFLQPCSCQNTEEVVAYIQAHPQWRLSLQTHKLIHIQ